MQIIADLQIHSKYSRAVSQQMNLDEIHRWAAKKGINLMATGDWTHPLWFREIKQNLKEVNSGIFALKRPPVDAQNSVYFLLSTEISSIYSHGGKVRRIHNLIFSPSITTCEKIIKALENRGCNLMSDGRPIIGISSVDLLKMVLEIDENCLFIPAHIWTPWFSLHGSKSGFDSIEECFGNYSKYIYAIETGLSSDPVMNWQIKDLDNRTILSFSDAHSGPKLGREATVFIPTIEQLNNETMKDLTYNDLATAIKQSPNSKLKVGYTIEFFPEEGKYHWSGHRLCNIRYPPQEIKSKGVTCPVCHKPLTIGVENRVLDLSSRIIDHKSLKLIKNQVGVTFVYDPEKTRRPFVSLIPLQEILLEVNNHSQAKAAAEYERLTTSFASEFDILLKKSLTDIEAVAGQKLREAVEIVRNREVFVDPGYDGVFGIVKIFGNNNHQVDKNHQINEQRQPTLF